MTTDPSGFSDNVKRELENVRDRLSGEEKKLVYKWAKSIDYEPATMEHRIARVRRIAEHTHTPIQNLDFVGLDRVIDEMGEQNTNDAGGYASGTRRKYLQAFSDFAEFNDLDVADDLQVPSVSQSKVTENDVLSVSEVQTLIEEAKKNRTKAVIATLFEGGFRLTALLSLKIKHYEQKEKYAIVKIPIKGIGLKGAEGRKKPLTWSSGYVDTWLSEHPQANDDSAALFCRKDKKEHHGEHLTDQAIRKRLNKTVENTEIDNDRVYPHAFRHARATFLRKSDDYDLSDIEHNLDWSEGTNQHQRYEHVTQDEKVDSLLRSAGIETEETEVEQESVECPRCNQLAPAQSSYCPVCSLKLTDEIPEWFRYYRKIIDGDDEIIDYYRNHPIPPNFGQLGPRAREQVLMALLHAEGHLDPDFEDHPYLTAQEIVESELDVSSLSEDDFQNLLDIRVNADYSDNLEDRLDRELD